MLMNYHEMTLNEPRDSPAKRKQFTIITAVMAAFFSYAIMTSGVLLPIEATEGIFPGGNFCYKLAHRDYAASLALGRRVIHDVVGSEKTPTDTESRPVEEIMYHLFLDSPREVGGRNLRWATGILVADKEKEKVDKLLSLNQPKGKKAEAKRYPTEQEMIDLSASEAMDLLPYEVTDLPSVDSLVVQFPHTHGFVSALTMSYKVRTCEHSKTISWRAGGLVVVGRKRITILRFFESSSSHTSFPSSYPSCIDNNRLFQQ